MKTFKLSNSGERGWFIGNFSKAIYQTKDFEVCYQCNPRGHTDSHYHKEITEINLIISGSLLINGELLGPGEVYVMYPGDISQLQYLEESQVVAIKTPSIPNDKFLL